jgi:uncharacterized membrane protein YidH (DUF202 family)
MTIATPDIIDAPALPPEKKTGVGGWIGTVVGAIQRYFENRRRFTEEEHKAPFMAYVLTFAVSLSAIVLFSSKDVQLIVAPNSTSADIILGCIRIFIIGVTVIVADNAVVRSFMRIGPLFTRGEDGMAWEHIAYIAFVMFINATTFFLVASASAQSILTGQLSTSLPFLDGGSSLIVIEAAKAVLVVWTALQILITGGKMLAEWSTILREAGGILGQKGQDWLQNMRSAEADISDIFNAYSEVLLGLTRPKKRLLKPQEQERMKQEYEARHRVIESLKTLGDKKQLEFDMRMQEMEARLNQALLDANTRIDAERSTAYRQLLPHLIEVIETGKWPDSLLEVAPEYRAIDPIKLMKGAGIKTISKGKATANGSVTQGVSYTEALSSVGITPINKVIRKGKDGGLDEIKTGVALKGGWITSAHILTLCDNKLTKEEATELAKRHGNEFKSGLSYACKLMPVLKELADRHILIEPIASWYLAQKETRADENSGEFAAVSPS